MSNLGIDAFAFDDELHGSASSLSEDETGAVSSDRLKLFAQEHARNAVADSLTAAIHADPRSLREIAKAAGMDPGNLSRAAKGENCKVETLARIALSLGKSLHISIA